MHSGLKHSNVAATVAVRDMATARRFYEGVVGLTVDAVEGDEAVSYVAGETRLFVYVSDFAGGNGATAATWSVEDIDATVQTLSAEGVRFERYDMPGMHLVGDIHVGSGMRLAWFKDPDGNIHALVEE